MNNKQAIGSEQLQKANMILRKYKSGKTALEHKIIENEQWWKLRHWKYIKGGNPYDMKPASAWLFNVIINKHADGIEAFPEPNILPREINDREEAARLSSIIPAVLEQNDFEETYSDVLWQKLKTGTGVYGVFWDPSKLNGLGDIAIRKVDLLNLFWEPGITDLQKSRNVFCTELTDNELLEEMYPELKGRLVGNELTPARYIYDDNVDTSGKSVVVDWYYKKRAGGREILHYCKYVGNTVIYATENDTERRITGEDELGNPIFEKSRAERGWYDHGKYPFVFDRLFPAEGTPCGFGYIDVCKNTQEQIDRLGQAIMKNAVMASTPRFFIRGDGSINEKEFTDWTKPVVHVNGNLGADSIRNINVPNLGEIYMAVLSSKISELRETSGNNEASTGNTPSGVTAASAIAALQEAAGKTSRASTLSAYRAYSRVILQVIELIRQFYELPRQFRITGTMGEDRFVAYSNSNIKESLDGLNGWPVFDIKVSAQRKTAYSKVQQNELALQLYQSGCFNPELSGQALLLLETMDFDGKERIMRRVMDNADNAKTLQGYRELALALAREYDPEVFEKISAMGGNEAKIKKAAVKKLSRSESPITLKARKRASAATMPR